MMSYGIRKQKGCENILQMATSVLRFELILSTKEWHVKLTFVTIKYIGESLDSANFKNVHMI